MPKAVAKILNLFSTKVIEKYKPIIIGVFDDDEKGTAGMMIKKVLQDRYDVHSGGSTSKADTAIALATFDLVLKGSRSRPGVMIIQMDTCGAVDMKKMLEVVRPDIAIFSEMKKTCPKHIKRDATEKALFFRSLKKDNVAIFSAADENLKTMAQKSRCAKITFGFDAQSTVRGEIFHGGNDENAIDGKKGTSFKITYKGTIVPFHFSTEVDERQIYAALSATAVGLHLGSNLVEISEAMRK